MEWNQDKKGNKKREIWQCPMCPASVTSEKKPLLASHILLHIDRTQGQDGNKFQCRSQPACPYTAKSGVILANHMLNQHSRHKSLAEGSDAFKTVKENMDFLLEITVAGLEARDSGYEKEQVDNAPIVPDNRR